MTKGFIRSESGVLGSFEANCATTGRTMDLIVALPPGALLLEAGNFLQTPGKGFDIVSSFNFFSLYPTALGPVVEAAAGLHCAITAPTWQPATW